MTDWQDYWNLFDELIGLLTETNQTKIINEFKEAQTNVNGLTDGWFEFLFAFEKSMQSNRQDMTADQKEIAEFLIDSLKTTLKRR